jgi:predicted metal-binding membrane protein
MSETTIEALLRRDRVIIGGALAVVVVAAWFYLVYLASSMSGMMDGEMSGMPGMAMLAMNMWSWVEVVALAVMWTVMMIAMMAPSAAPMILVYAAIYRRRAAAGTPSVPTAIFVLGYLVVWTIFSIVAALVQAGLHIAALLSPAMVASSPLLAGALLVATGIFQWTPLKRACLATCRSPLSFVMTAWREGRGGALIMGIRHGLYCLGCCWALMALLFVAGVMNLVWIAVLALAVLVEKAGPGGDVVGRGAGVLLVGAGLWVAMARVP